MGEILFPSVPSLISLTILGALFGLVLSIVKKTLRVEKDPRIEKIEEILPGANCGACGFPGCAGYAASIVNDGVPLNLCPVGGKEVIEKMADVMNVEAEMSSSKIARVHCQGGNDVTKIRFIYDGPLSCWRIQGMRIRLPWAWRLRAIMSL
ncbi:MAG: RnfABCDGE type electron transport complex subunit B [Spirochaetota bacterium]